MKLAERSPGGDQRLFGPRVGRPGPRLAGLPVGVGQDLSLEEGENLSALIVIAEYAWCSFETLSLEVAEEGVDRLGPRTHRPVDGPA